ncbi:MAG TPA: glucuronate isomerase, partial [Candidatus Aphodomorpha intestinavium]|nr:glucuronate isomerase [Candidatus Aphodomorpha intestinavium]
MKPFLDKDFLLGSDTARALYHDHAEKMPIVDYHCHIDPNEIADDRRYESITQVWLGGDHYKWRAMRSAGVPERLITGDADPEEKFLAWAETVPKLIGNPLYHWTHLELQRYFGIDEPLSGRNAKAVYRACNEALAKPELSVRGIIKKSNVKLICTTDDPADGLSAHARIAADPTCEVAVLPAFRPDKAMRADKP